MNSFKSIARLSLFLGVGILASEQGAAQTLDEVRGFLNQNPKIDNPYDFMSALPRNMRMHYNLAFSSQTNEAERRLVSSTNPRIILNAIDGSLALPYGGERGYLEKRVFFAITPGSKVVELTYFDGSTFVPAKFVFRRSSPYQNVNSSVPAVNLFGQVQSCYRCHIGNRYRIDDGREAQASFRPNWETYPLWPGLFGSINHGFSALVTGDSRSTQEYIHKEKVELDKFLRTVASDKNSIYRNLVGWESLDLTKLAEMNEKTGLAFSGMNGTRIASQIKSHPAHAQMSEWILPLDKTSSFSLGFLSVPAGVAPENVAKEFSRKLNEYTRGIKQYEHYKRTRAAAVLGLSKNAFTYYDFEMTDIALTTYLSLVWQTYAPELADRVQSWPLTFGASAIEGSGGTAFVDGIRQPLLTPVLQSLRPGNNCPDLLTQK